MDTWGSIKSGREALGDYLAGLSENDWNTASLCAGWSVKDAAAHMLVIPTVSKGQVFRSFLGSGFNLDKMNAKFVKKMTANMSTADIAAKTRASAGSQSMPPGLTDAEWSIGSGPTVEGPAQLLLLAVAGRRSALERLSGEGLATLRAR